MAEVELLAELELAVWLVVVLVHVLQEVQSQGRREWMRKIGVDHNRSTLLPMAEFVMNAHRSSASDHTPFELIYGYTPDFMIPPGRLVGMPHVDKCLQALEKAHKEAQAALRMSKNQMRSDLTTQPKKP